MSPLSFIVGFNLVERRINNLFKAKNILCRADNEISEMMSKYICNLVFKCYG